MRRFAEIDSAGIVQRVIVAESAEWCEQALGGEWVETFKDRSQRTHYASAGYTYDPERDAFIPPKPFESWVLDETTCLWVAPVDMPDDGKEYRWDEDSTSWVEIVEAV